LKLSVTVSRARCGAEAIAVVIYRFARNECPVPCPETPIFPAMMVWRGEVHQNMNHCRGLETL